MTEGHRVPHINWGAVTIGAMAGLTLALIAFIILGVSGVVAPNRGEILLLFLEFLALVVAGYVAGRLSDTPSLHGGLAGLLTALITGIVSLTSNRNPLAGVITLTLVAVVLGTAGGILARWQREVDQR